MYAPPASNKQAERDGGKSGQKVNFEVDIIVWQ